jgi:hypothetical protein
MIRPIFILSAPANPTQYWWVFSFEREQLLSETQEEGAESEITDDVPYSVGTIVGMLSCLFPLLYVAFFLLLAFIPSPYGCNFKRKNRVLTRNPRAIHLSRFHHQKPTKGVSRYFLSSLPNDRPNQSVVLQHHHKRQSTRRRMSFAELANVPIPDEEGGKF